MKNKLYFPLEVNMMNSKKESMLISVHGPKGFGAYVMVLMELRNSTNYRCTMEVLCGMARKCKIRPTLLKAVVYEYQLFDVTHEEDGTEVIASPYLERVMEPYEERLSNLSKAGRKNTDTAKRNSGGRFTINDGTLDKDKDKDNPTPPTPSAVVEPFLSWESYLAAAVADEIWMELLAMNSGMSLLFMKHREVVVESFRQHVRLQGSERGIGSVRDAKSYFANFIRQGTPTQKRIADRLRELEQESARNSPNAFETVDPLTGLRSYFGNPIPPGAPFRPNANAVWSEELHQWM